MVDISRSEHSVEEDEGDVEEEDEEEEERDLALDLLFSFTPADFSLETELVDFFL